jgi:serine/threonine-protein kinase
MIGRIVNGKYKIVEKLGTGGSGEVFKAYHIHLQTPWALKLISSMEDCAQNELEILRSLNHPAFPRLVDVFDEEGQTILVFDYFEGLTLQKVIEQYGPVEEQRARNMAFQILDALSYLHNCSPEPIIYRDLKPSNLMLLPDDSIRLIDFGTARLFKQQNADDTVYLGTPGYAAPEQYGAAQTDVRTDIYNFGMTMFHVVTGKHPLQCSETQREQFLGMAGVSQQFTSVLLRCVSASPQERYSSIDEIRKALKEGSSRLESIPAALGKNAVEISVSGIQRGIGVTHFCLMFGMWLKNQGFRTAVLEYGENRDAIALAKLVEKESHVEKHGFFQIHGLSIFPSMGKEKIDGFKRSEYDYILVDYGVHDAYVSLMVRRSDVRLILAPGADWKLGLLGDFLRGSQGNSDNMNTYLCFPFQNQKSIQIIQSYFRLSNLITIPCVMNPWKPDQEEKRALEMIYEKLFQADNRMSHTGKRRTYSWHF